MTTKTSNTELTVQTLEQVIAAAEFMVDAGVGISVLDTSGKILFANDAVSFLYCGVPADQVIGKQCEEVALAEAMRERVALTRLAFDRGRPLVVRDVWKGIAVQAVLRRLEPSPMAPLGAVRVVTRRECVACAAMGTRCPHCEPHCATTSNDLGVLGVLSPRELEVAALIGEGLSNAEIASRLYRSEKTVEYHRSSIASKTGVESRIKLASLVQRARLGEMLQIDRLPAPIGQSAHDAPGRGRKPVAANN